MFRRQIPRRCSARPGEIISAICAADANGSVIVSAEKSAKGCCVQFMHLGALFNPCPKAPDSITQKCMDEISFEFKYGRNVLSVFRRANSDKNIQEVKEMKEIQIRNHSIKPGDKIAVINEHSKADIPCARRGSCKRRQLRCGRVEDRQLR